MDSDECQEEKFTDSDEVDTYILKENVVVL